MENSEDLSNMNEILTERELIDLLGIKKSALDDFRYNQLLPFCRISKTNRIYIVRDVLDFIKSKRIILNRGSG